LLGQTNNKADMHHPAWFHRKSSSFAVVPMMQSWNVVGSNSFIQAQGNEACDDAAED
jgi:hypothetical protein